MKFHKSILIVFILIITTAFTSKNSNGYKVGDTIEDFNLINIDDKMVSLSDYTDAKGFIIIFTCNHCPYSVAYEDRIIALGGIAKKSSFVMQVMADVLNSPIKVAKSEQACALGASVFGAVAAGVYPNTESAMDAMASPFEKVYEPIKENVVAYKEVYKNYSELCVAMENHIMQ
mgnify:CR=1 FL=1